MKLMFKIKRTAAAILRKHILGGQLNIQNSDLGPAFLLRVDLG